MEQSHLFNQLLSRLEKYFFGPVTETLFNNHDQIAPNSKSIYNQSVELQKASSLFGYLSSEHPIIGKSTESRHDLEIARQFLRLNRLNDEYANFLTYEMITKILAYRDLHVGDEFDIPFVIEQQPRFVPFVVEAIFDLWLKMPAFALTSKDPRIPSILLFRGTVFSMVSKPGIASMLTDLDPEGPGFKVFLKSRAELQSYLIKEGKKIKPRVMGYSLGGCFASYFLLYDYDLLNQSKEFPSVIFQAPGIYDKNQVIWNNIRPNERPSVLTFAANGDIVSKVGYAFGDLIKIAPNDFLPPITSHVQLYFSEKKIYVSKQPA